MTNQVYRDHLIRYNDPTLMHHVRPPRDSLSHLGHHSWPMHVIDTPTTQTTRTGGTGIGHALTNRLLPSILDRSERPIKLVMNYGNLYLEDTDFTTSSSAWPYYDSRDREDPEQPNTIIYNAPGSTMTITSPDSRGRASLLGRSPSPIIRTVSPSPASPATLVPITEVGYHMSSPYRERDRDWDWDWDRDRDKRVVAMCLGCFKRQLVCSSGYCAECDFYTGGSSVSASPDRMVTAGESYHRDRDGYVVRRVRTFTRSPELVSSLSSGWKREKDRERDRDRDRFKARERAWERKERERRYSGGGYAYYTSDSDDLS